MEIKILKSEKKEIEFQVDSLTIAELLRVYLNKEAEVTFAAWKREHPTKAPIIKVKTKSKDVKKLIKDVSEKISKELIGFKADFKKLK
jgi:DNA-directed RNA polymerase subunit L